MNQGPTDPLRVLVTRPQQQGEKLALRIRALGCYALVWPLLHIAELEQPQDAKIIDNNEALFAQFSCYDGIVIVSANAARGMLRLVDKNEIVLPDAPCFYAIGSASAEVLTARGLSVKNTTGAMDSESLLQLPELQRLGGQQLLICRGLGGRTFLADNLRARGARVDEAALYRRLCPSYAIGSLAQALREHQIDVVQLSSGETLENLLHVLGSHEIETFAEHLRLIVPGRRVESLAREAGFRNICRAVNPTDDGIIAELKALMNPGPLPY